ncbi:MAG: diacylglycerol kinase family lipid kinase [Rhodothermia bacterium]|nr:diacylglycerol kinase family lipid kinase [Rhodothermia bacterium]
MAVRVARGVWVNTAIIVNPTAGRGLAARRLDAVVAAFGRHGIRPRVMATDGRGHARRLAEESSSAYELVVALGGDGTVHEAAWGLHSSGGDAAFAVIPSGSGNDFAKMLGLPSRIDEIVTGIVDGEERRVDVGVAAIQDVSGTSIPGFFVNAIGMGFDSMVAERARRSRKIRGTLGYLWVALSILRSWRPMSMSVSADGWRRKGDTLMVTLGNGACSGGGFYLTPDADLFDGQLDLCLVEGRTVPKMLVLLPRTFKGGHVRAKGVTYMKTTRAVVAMGRPIPVHVDGEILTEQAVEVEIKVLPSALTIRAPFRR